MMAEDSEEYQARGERLEAGLLSVLGQFGQISAGVAEAMREPRFEYRIVQWGQVNPLAAEGWELRAAHMDLTSFVMSRKLGPADDAAALLAKAAHGLPSVSPEHLANHERDGTECVVAEPEDGAGRPG